MIKPALMLSRMFTTLLLVGLAGCMVMEEATPVDTNLAVSRRVAAGYEYLRIGRPIDARRHISRALEHDPRSAEAHNAMALLYQYEADFKRAEDHFRRALRYDGDYSLARNNYGALLMRQERYRDALEQFDRAASDPSYDNRAIAFENKGRALMSLQRYGEALDAFNTALRLDSSNPEPLLEMAWAHFLGGQPDPARRAYDAYANAVETQSARGLWLGIRLAAQTKDATTLAAREKALDTTYPDSIEFRLWRRWVAEGRKP